jgi:hypothetical protein
MRFKTCSFRFQNITQYIPLSLYDLQSWMGEFSQCFSFGHTVAKDIRYNMLYTFRRAFGVLVGLQLGWDCGEHVQEVCRRSFDAEGG